jgi:NAD(P)-dependent dehydrogenase (short-subunit alcohol dehydrogenase family)
MSLTQDGPRPRRVVVTGASSGIGRAVALHLGGRSGTHVALIARRRDRLEEVAARIRAAGGAATVIVADLAAAEDCERAVRESADALGGLDVLVHCAGILRSSAVLEQTSELIDEVLALDVRAAMLCTKAAGEVMRAGGGGSILLVGSVFGTKAVRTFSAYCAAKAAVQQFTRVAALELARDGVRVNALAPGYILTELNAAELADERIRDAVLQRIPIGRIAQPEDLLGAVELLCGPAGSYITGETLVVDGGYQLR